MRKLIRFVATVFLIVIVCNMNIVAANETTETENESKEYDSTQKYRLGDVVKSNSDYSSSKPIKAGDFHYGWNLGSFYVDGFSSVISENTDNVVFLKTVGDKITLYFNLEQDINELDGSSRKWISDDGNGIDEYFGIPKQKFHHGALIIRKTNYRNEVSEPQVYTDYLKGVEVGADTVVDIFEEGDYEVALDYQITYKANKVLWIQNYDYEQYRIFFKFSVRNGNCMAYPFDVATGAELANSSVTENGFRLDLANSKYLDIAIKKEILNEGADGLTEDVRFNKPAKDGEEFTDEGIYTITVSNRYTKTTTEKVIYVGTNPILRAYAATGLPISDIRAKINDGATISEEGFIILSNNQIIDNKEGTVKDYVDLSGGEETENDKDIINENEGDGRILKICIAIASILSIILLCLMLFLKKDMRK